MNNFDFDNHHYDTSAYEDRTLHDLLHQSRRNLDDLILMINRQFDHHSRLLVIRLDLSYKPEVTDSVPLEYVQRHRNLLLNNRRNYPDVYGGLLSFAWNLEKSEKSGGYHYHMLFLFDGSIRRDDISVARGIGNLWYSITEGYGMCYISNFDKKKFEFNGALGIGMVHRFDVQKRINLIEKVAPYLTKKCAEFDIQSGATESGDFRTFGRSWMPPALNPDLPRRGRPVA